MVSSVQPLSWTEARRDLKDILEDYLDDEHPREPFPEPPVKGSFVQWIVWYDVDLYGAFVVTGILLILTSVSLHERRGGLGSGALRPAASMQLYRADVAASVLLFVGCLIGLWLTRRRRVLCRTGGTHSKKREIYSFLHAMDELQPENVSKLDESGESSSMLAGSSLVGIYHVYRKTKRKGQWVASWERVPALLLVKGDVIALHVGNVAPAWCRSLDHPQVTLSMGHVITLDDLQQLPEEILSKMPRGRTTLASNSEHLLKLQLWLRLFVVLETPAREFLRKPHHSTEPARISKQIHRVRAALAVMGPLMLFTTALIVFLRPEVTKGDVSMVLPIPIVAALGFLPVVTPTFLFFIEVLGMSRILHSVHECREIERGNKMRRGFWGNLRLLCRYMGSTLLSRLSLWSLALRFHHNLERTVPAIAKLLSNDDDSRLVRTPPASLEILENLGQSTAFALVDDELAAEEHSVPQQLLIPTGAGLKLLDLCPAYEESSDEEDFSDRRRLRRSFDSEEDSDDSDGESTAGFHGLRLKFLQRKSFRRRRRKKAKARPDSSSYSSESSETDSDDSDIEVQFEDPLWWQYIPSLKGIGLASLIIGDGEGSDDPLVRDEDESPGAKLARTIARERKSEQLRLLGECIGFTPEDVSSFKEKLRVNMISARKYCERLQLDVHERSSEQSRWWGFLRPDCTSVVVRDARSSAHQLLTIGDPSLILSLCNEAWQGEISTILPIGSIDRSTIMNTTNEWLLDDLDVTAFAYAPLPHSQEDVVRNLLDLDGTTVAKRYLFDHAENSNVLKDKHVSQEWTLIRNQIFLGVLGSQHTPRREIHSLLNVLNDAGCRFVYFSPRNMRRQKGLVSQMGIDVAWNCAISLRPLLVGEEDPHRMKSQYADWDVNARLPHGVEAVRKHLVEVDNVPLLVSLYTDASKTTTREMVEIFQQYSDTVIAVGLSHLPWNDGIFGTADVAVSIDVLTPHVDVADWSMCSIDAGHTVYPELEFVSRICSHSCAFRFKGRTALSSISTVIAQGRGALDAATTSGIYFLTGSISLALFALFSACAPAAAVPYVPLPGAAVYLEMILPLIGFNLAMTSSDKNVMNRVPPKNDPASAFAKREGKRLYQMIFYKALVPALLTQLLHMIAFGELILVFDGDFAQDQCPGADSWVDIVRCTAVRDYTGPARRSAGVIVMAEFVLCHVLVSASFVRRFVLIKDELPWDCNAAWLPTVTLSVALVAIYANRASEPDTSASLPWYFYFLCAVLPFLCVAWAEYWKRVEIRHERRSEQIRRLQFDTRLGAWSPK